MSLSNSFLRVEINYKNFVMLMEGACMGIFLTRIIILVIGIAVYRFQEIRANK